AFATDLLERRESAEAPVWRVETGEPGGWVSQMRDTDGGEPVEVLASLSRGRKGAEQHTGRVVSRAFAMPERLAFRLCGHLGLPGEEANGKNFVLLLDAADGRELALALPPRKDQAVLVEWRFLEIAGRE